MPESTSRPRVTVPDVIARKNHHLPLTMITAYDATFAKIVDESGVDMILVGDSVGSVVQGVANTIPVTLEEMEYHQVNTEQAVRSAIRLVKAGAAAVKLEGGVTMQDAIAAISRVDIPVMGHIGLTPQSYHRMGGHRVQGRAEGRDPGGKERLLEDAHSVEQAGAFAVVIEGVPRELAREITQKISIPTIGIGAGPDCDGQVLVLHDILGLSPNNLKFTRKYANVRELSIQACSEFVHEVRARQWPDDDHSFH
jgi:3-methyl-2-oxobutanoate hydroxymethyltransferase